MLAVARMRLLLEDLKGRGSRKRRGKDKRKRRL
jgi:hypothetical protein